MRKLNIILNYFNIYIYIYSIHYAYTIVTYYCIGRWINSYAGRNLKVHIRSHQHHPTPYSENMVTSALQDVPDVACILTASMVATWRKWDALRILPMKNPLQGHPMANTLENFHGWNPNAMEVDGQDDLPFSIMWFLASSPSFSRVVLSISFNSSGQCQTRRSGKSCQQTHCCAQMHDRCFQHLGEDSGFMHRVFIVNEGR